MGFAEIVLENQIRKFCVVSNIDGVKKKNWWNILIEEEFSRKANFHLLEKKKNFLLFFEILIFVWNFLAEIFMIILLCCFFVCFF